MRYAIAKMSNKFPTTIAEAMYQAETFRLHDFYAQGQLLARIARILCQNQRVLSGVDSQTKVDFQMNDNQTQERYLACMHVFLSKDCGYSNSRIGATCDRSFEQCRAFGNEQNFGGHPIDTAKPNELVMHKSTVPKPTSKRVVCRLCNCEGVQGTVLCKEHLEGYMLAIQWLRNKGHRIQAYMLELCMQQRNEYARWL